MWVLLRISTFPVIPQKLRVKRRTKAFCMASHEMDQHRQADPDGRFRRQDAQFRSTISKDGPFPPEKGRYLLYCALICPWACRTLIVRSLKGLEDVIGIR